MLHHKNHQINVSVPVIVFDIGTARASSIAFLPIILFLVLPILAQADDSFMKVLVRGPQGKITEQVITNSAYRTMPIAERAALLQAAGPYYPAPAPPAPTVVPPSPTPFDGWKTNVPLRAVEAPVYTRLEPLAEKAVQNTSLFSKIGSTLGEFGGSALKVVAPVLRWSGYGTAAYMSYQAGDSIKEYYDNKKATIGAGLFNNGNNRDAAQYACTSMGFKDAGLMNCTNSVAGQLDQGIDPYNINMTGLTLPRVSRATAEQPAASGPVAAPATGDPLLSQQGYEWTKDLGLSSKEAIENSAGCATKKGSTCSPLEQGAFYGSGGTTFTPAASPDAGSGYMYPGEEPEFSFFGKAIAPPARPAASTPAPARVTPKPLPSPTGGTSATASILGGSESECAEMYPDAYGSYLVCLQNGKSPSGSGGNGSEASGLSPVSGTGTDTAGSASSDARYGESLQNCIDNSTTALQEFNCEFVWKQRQTNGQSAGSVSQAPTTPESGPAPSVAGTSVYERGMTKEEFIDACLLIDGQNRAECNRIWVWELAGSSVGSGGEASEFAPQQIQTDTDNWDPSIMGNPSSYGLTPAPVAPVRATEFVSGGIYDKGFLVGMREGPTANYAPTYKTGWGWFDRVVLQIPDSTPSAPAPQRAPTVQTTGPVRQAVPVTQSTIAADAVVSENKQSPSCLPSILSFFNGSWNNCDGGNAAPAQSGPVQQFQPYNENIEYPENKYYGATIDANIDSNKDDVLNVEEYVDEYYRQNPPAEAVIIEPEITDNNYMYMEIDNTFRGYDVRYYNEPTDSWENWYYDYDGINYTAPTRQFSTAEPSSNPLENQSLAASALGAFLSQ